MALDESILSAVANSNFKATSEIPGLLSNTMAADIVAHSRNATASMIQTASDSRNAASAALNVLTKRIAELDPVESSAVAPVSGHTQQYAAASGAGMQSAQLGQSMIQLGNAQQAIQVQLAQLVALLTAQAGSAA